MTSEERTICASIVPIQSRAVFLIGWFQPGTGAVFLSQGEAGVQGLHPGGAGGIGQGGCCNTNPGMEATREFPPFMEPEQYPRAKCIACASSPGDVFLGEI